MGLAVHEHHIWRVDEIKALVADQREATTFVCGGSRNFAKFIDLFDGVFVLEVDVETLTRRVDERPGTSGVGEVDKRNRISYSGCIARKRTFHGMAS